ncbi:MAG: carbamoyl phosphate synthase large subunit [Gammaproteobacteria bacterium RIFCSPHIGHO2_12_FULL_45_9]|nr:MAG: carbamoyl phosphate synthase large subunit [Gammaproteobacteria bacterium RIFCSPHIGHO2_12_FULL_45_9]
MPKRTDLQRILILGAGPIVIGQACEFDYSGSQACRALREEGYYVILVNSNPATIMTDPELADATYIEPIEWQTVARIIAREKPDALLPTLGGQTALNCALDLVREGVLGHYGVELIGASCDAINKAEDRLRFQEAMTKIGLKTPRSGFARSMDEAWAVLERVNFPAIIRPCFTMGGSGSGIAYNREEYQTICERGLSLSPTHELLIDQSILGWKEFELEVVRDKKDNAIIVCAIENVDPMGIHTGDSITVAPTQTLTDKEYQIMREAAIAILREIGVETGGANVQFAVNPEEGTLMVIEMNPRVSRSSALASKATGFPIAKIAAKLAVGYTLDELKNDITNGETPASFEPTIDYVVTKIPRFNFEKFPKANTRLTTQMKSVGEAMAMGRNFQESLQKALSSLERGFSGLTSQMPSNLQAEERALMRERVVSELRIPGPDRLWYVADAFRLGMTVEEIYAACHIDHWFLIQLQDLVNTEHKIMENSCSAWDQATWHAIKQKGFSDARIAELSQMTEQRVRELRWRANVHPVYKRVDTCAGEFKTSTAYLYSTYDSEDESAVTDREKIMVLGSGPNRIGQGIEFDYCCVHAALAMRELGYETIMVNCNPETVSTDYDISDRLYFEPLTLEHVLEIVLREKPKGVIVQYGGQTPLKLAQALSIAGVPIIGTSPDSIDQAEDRARFQKIVKELGLRQPPNGIVRSVEEGLRLANVFAYPLVVRPSYVLGGRAMQVVYNEDELSEYMRTRAVLSATEPLLLDHFLDDATEVDVDAVCDGTDVLIGGILEHIEQAGVHSGDSACAFPPHSLTPALQSELKEQVRQLAHALQVVGLINVQFAIQKGKIYLLEVNPRASRTVPFLAKATGLSLAKIAAKCMVGHTLREQGYLQEVIPPYFSVKKPVFPFNKFPDVDPLLGPEMRSTGEVMGIGDTFGEAYFKAQLAVGDSLPSGGLAFVSVRDADKQAAVFVAEQLRANGFEIVATGGTAQALLAAGVSCERVNKVTEGRPHIVDRIKNDEIHFIVNTVEGERASSDSVAIRVAAVLHRIPYVTTLSGAEAVCSALNALHPEQKVRRLQELV